MPTCYMWEDTVYRKEEKEKENGQEEPQNHRELISQQRK